MSHDQKLTLELRRGVLTLAVLQVLREPSYGYALQQRLTALGLEIEQGTLYPLMRRLEEQGLLTSDWTTDEARPRKYYRLSHAGETTLMSLRSDWRRLVEVVDGLFDGPRGT